MRWKGLRRGWDDGSTAVEAAVVFSLLFTLSFGIVEFGMALWQWNKMQAELPGASISCPLPANPAAGAWYVCATTTAGAPNTMSLSANYGYNIIGFAGPFNVTAQATVPLD